MTKPAPVRIPSAPTAATPAIGTRILPAFIAQAAGKISTLETNFTELQQRLGNTQTTAEILPLLEGTTPEDFAQLSQQDQLDALKLAAFNRYSQIAAQAKELSTRKTPQESQALLANLLQAQQSFLLAMRAAEILQMQVIVGSCETLLALSEEHNLGAITAELESLRHSLAKVEETPALEVFESRLDELAKLHDLQSSMVAMLTSPDSTLEIRKLTEAKLELISRQIADTHQENTLPFHEAFSGVIDKTAPRTQEHIDALFDEFAAFGQDIRLLSDQELARDAETKALKTDALQKEIATRTKQLEKKAQKNAKLESDAEAAAARLEEALRQQKEFEEALQEKEAALAQTKEQNQKEERRLSRDLSEKSRELRDTETSNAKLGFFKRATGRLFGIKAWKTKPTAALQTEVTALEEQLESGSYKIDSRQNETEILALKTQLRAAERELGKIENELQTLNEKLGKDRVSGLQEELAQFEEELAATSASASGRKMFDPADTAKPAAAKKPSMRPLYHKLRGVADEIDMDPVLRKERQKEARKEATETSRTKKFSSAFEEEFESRFVIEREISKGTVKAKKNKVGLALGLVRSAAAQAPIPGLEAAVGIVEFIYNAKRRAESGARADFAMTAGETLSERESIRRGITQEFANQLFAIYSLKTDGRSPLDVLSARGIGKFTTTMVDKVMEDLPYFQLPNQTEMPRVNDTLLKTDATYRENLAQQYGVEIDVRRLGNPIYFNHVARQLEEKLYVEFVAQKLVESVVHTQTTSPRSEFLSKTRFSKEDLANPQDRTFTFEGFTKRVGVVFADGTMMVPTSKKEGLSGIGNKYGFRQATAAEEKSLARRREEETVLSGSGTTAAAAPALASALPGYTTFVPAAQAFAQSKQALVYFLTPQDFATPAAYDSREAAIDEFLQGYYEAKLLNPGLHLHDHLKSNPFIGDIGTTRRGLATAGRLVADLPRQRLYSIEAELEKTAETYFANKAAQLQENARANYDLKKVELLQILRPQDFTVAVSAEQMSPMLDQMFQRFEQQRTRNPRLSFDTFLKSDASQLNTGLQSTFGLTGRKRDAQRMRFNLDLKEPLAAALAAYQKLNALDAELAFEDFSYPQTTRAAASSEDERSAAAAIDEEDVEVEVGRADMFVEVDALAAQQVELSQEDLAEFAEFSDEPTIKRESLQVAAPRDIGTLSALGHAVFGAAKSALDEVGLDVDLDIVPDSLEAELGNIFAGSIKVATRMAQAAQDAAQRLEQYTPEALATAREAVASLTEEITELSAQTAAAISKKSEVLAQKAEELAGIFEEKASELIHGPAGEMLAAHLAAHAIKLGGKVSRERSAAGAFDARMEDLLSTMVPSDLKDPALTPDVATALRGFAEGYHAQVLAGANLEQRRLFIAQNLPVNQDNLILTQKVAGLAELYSQAMLAKSDLRISAAESLAFATSGVVSFVADAVAPSLVSGLASSAESATVDVAQMLNLSAGQQELLAQKVAKITGQTVAAQLASAGQVAANKVRTAFGIEAQEGEISTVAQVLENREAAEIAQKSFEEKHEATVAALTAADFIDPAFQPFSREFLNDVAQKYAQEEFDFETTSAAEFEEFFARTTFATTGNDALREALVDYCESYKTAQTAQEIYQESLRQVAENLASELVGSASARLGELATAVLAKVGMDVELDENLESAEEFAASRAADLVVGSEGDEKEIVELDPIAALHASRENLAQKQQTFDLLQQEFLAQLAPEAAVALTAESLAEFFHGYDAAYQASNGDEAVLENYVTTHGVAGAQNIELQEAMVEMALSYTALADAQAIANEATQVAINAVQEKFAATVTLAAATQESEAQRLELVELAPPMVVQDEVAAAVIPSPKAADETSLETNSAASSVTASSTDASEPLTLTKAQTLLRANALVKQYGSALAFRATMRANQCRVTDDSVSLPQNVVASEGAKPCSLTFVFDASGSVCDVELHGGAKTRGFGDKRELFDGAGMVKQTATKSHVAGLNELFSQYEEVARNTFSKAVSRQEAETSFAAGVRSRRATAAQEITRL